MYYDDPKVDSNGTQETNSWGNPTYQDAGGTYTRDAWGNKDYK